MDEDSVSFLSLISLACVPEIYIKEMNDFLALCLSETCYFGDFV